MCLSSSPMRNAAWSLRDRSDVPNTPFAAIAAAADRKRSTSATPPPRGWIDDREAAAGCSRDRERRRADAVLDDGRNATTAPGGPEQKRDDGIAVETSDDGEAGVDEARVRSAGRRDARTAPDPASSGLGRRVAPATASRASRRIRLPCPVHVG